MRIKSEKQLIETNEQCVQLRRQIEIMHAKQEEKMKNVQEDHQSQLHKYQISQVMSDYSRRYQFEDKITDQQMQLKQVNEQN